ncbi:helix-turn-helix transcriptional regulator [Anaerotalea alkaliphila]|uniref:Helix-turn-helix domain-containing protein n=1 Tax=Anaerotalea alkaliphila TaxID=2662126 RepID=A0A7X5HVN0_9FIRM|nr:AraC family transcriptional regulator [Anaerotalea alkaliphila]NDL67495.1 helix-turn-helix domain-containing protein [Anaerotalea alkaliphila]
MARRELEQKANMLGSVVQTGVFLLDKGNREIYNFNLLQGKGAFQNLARADIQAGIRLAPPEENKVVLYTAPWKGVYILLPVHEEGSYAGLAAVGPLLQEILPEGELRGVLKFLRLREKEVQEVLECWDSLKAFSGSELKHLAALAAHLFWHPLASSVQVQAVQPGPDLSGKDKFHENLLGSHDFVDGNYRMEADLLHAIQTGNAGLLKTLEEDRRQMYIPNRTPENPLRTDRNLLVTLNSLACRAAIQGGVPLGIAHNMSSNFAGFIENARTAKQIQELNAAIPTVFCDAVRKYRTREAGPLVAKVLDQVYANLYKKLEVAEIAAELFVTPSHLSRKFKEEMGVTLSRFIQQAKCQEAEFLMAKGNHTLSEIGEMLQFNSLSHFSATYKKVRGFPPSRVESREEGKG